MHINEVTYGKLKTPLKMNGNLKSIKAEKGDHYSQNILSRMSIFGTSGNQMRQLLTRQVVIQYNNWGHCQE